MGPGVVLDFILPKDLPSSVESEREEGDGSGTGAATVHVVWGGGKGGDLIGPRAGPHHWEMGCLEWA